MQVHLDVEDGREAGRRFAHVSELGRLVDGDPAEASAQIMQRWKAIFISLMYLLRERPLTPRISAPVSNYLAQN
jgi:hypothetical protein